MLHSQQTHNKIRSSLCQYIGMDKNGGGILGNIQLQSRSVNLSAEF